MNIIEVYYKKAEFDTNSKAILKEIKAAGFQTSFNLKTERLYKINVEMSCDELNLIAQELLVDPVTQDYRVASTDRESPYQDVYLADIWLKNGVTDPVGETIERGIRTIGINHQANVHTGSRYLISQEVDKQEVDELIRKLLMNSVIHEYSLR
ncbi:MAG: phosphoribosylformylglycinamidine synthase subunit PurS [bacterium]|nr:phosphoribosylformylglycinamidine synthase subunit PurS [bacterium]